MVRANGNCAGCIIAISFALGQFNRVDLDACSDCQADDQPQLFRTEISRLTRSLAQAAEKPILVEIINEGAQKKLREEATTIAFELRLRQIGIRR